jgi:ABC-type Fe3+-hydroxamate transport system substrate-binding protein
VRELEEARSSMPRRSFTFAVPIWKEPWMWCGGDTYVSSLVETAGGTNIFAARSRYPAVPLGEVLAMRPDIVFLPDEPYAFTSEDAHAFAGPRVIGPFPGHLFTWHGVRTIEGLRFLRDALGSARPPLRARNA